jgi:hypothetical protein
MRLSINRQAGIERQLFPERDFLRRLGIGQGGMAVRND